ncbi:hypothetical protein [Clostridium beijerinckii]|uniref:hypothetical protein n=1 Tax=Clostridium beijerinckii TaxID=1520 RepID=UPI001F4C2AEB|nr:hypothetical protein [Clostridium beijerinckii]NRT93607.1 hypothetical protein [Clostridium beijerinckii]NRW56353.1 hypothetical protein [Clostridium beijerinckii]
MELMYVKYINGERHSIIKNGDDIIMSNSKIIKFDSAKKQKSNEHTPCLKRKIIKFIIILMIKLMKKLPTFSLMLSTKTTYLIEINRIARTSYISNFYKIISIIT